MHVLDLSFGDFKGDLGVFTVVGLILLVTYARLGIVLARFVFVVFFFGINRSEKLKSVGETRSNVSMSKHGIKALSHIGCSNTMTIKPPAISVKTILSDITFVP